jgi:hypothetical protein
LVVLVAVTALLSVVSAVLNRAAGTPAAGPAATEDRIMIACVFEEPAGDEAQVAAVASDACIRQALDAARRTRLTAGQQAQGQVAALAASAALRRADRDCQLGGGPGCPVYRTAAAGRGDPGQVYPRPAGSELDPAQVPMPEPGRDERRPVSLGEVDLIVSVLRQAGFGSAVVRLAGDQDPAPAGTVIYAIEAGPGCVVGHQRGVGARGSWQVVGRLPDGGCLSR